MAGAASVAARVLDLTSTQTSLHKLDLPKNLTSPLPEETTSLKDIDKEEQTTLKEEVVATIVSSPKEAGKEEQTLKEEEEAASIIASFKEAGNEESLIASSWSLNLATS